MGYDEGMALLTYTEASRVASERLRREIPEQLIQLWAGSHLSTYLIGRDHYVSGKSLEQHLARIEPEWRLLTIPEAVRRVHELVKREPSEETVRYWCTRGYLVKGERRTLPYTWDGRRRLICPMALREYLWTVVPSAKDHPVGRPLGKRVRA